MATLKKTAEKYWKKAIKKYRPIDADLRTKYPLYAVPASAANRAIRRVSGNFGDAIRYYIEHIRREPVDHSLVLFESFWGRKIACNPYACYRALRDDPSANHLRFVWVRNEGVATPADVAADPRVTFVEYNSRAYAMGLVTAGCLVSNSTFPHYFVRRPEQRYINLWHGVPLKHMGRDSDPSLGAVANTQRNFLHATDILLSGPYAAEKTVPPYGAGGLTMHKVREVGSPRIDLTLSTDRESIRARLGIPPEKQVVLYAPTWRGRVSGVSVGLQEQLDAIRALEAQEGEERHLLVSLHNYTRAKLKTLPDNCTFVPDDIDMNEVLAAVDVLVSDYSSIIVDYLVLDRPVVLYVPDRATYEAERGMYLSLDELPVALAYTVQDLIEAVAARRKPSSFASHEGMLKLLLPREDGQAAKRAADICLGRGPVTTPAPRKPRLLFHPGTMKPNGITASFVNLMSSIDHDRYEVCVMLDSYTIDRDQERQLNCQRLDPRCHLIIRRPQFNLTYDEREHYRTLTACKSLDEEAERVLAEGFAHEARRIFGDTEFDLAVDFSGYSHFWSLVISNANAKRKVIYQHSDLLSEAKHPGRAQKGLWSVFECYRYFDQVVAVSDTVAAVNQQNLAKYYRPGAEVRFVRNAMAQSIKRRAKVPIALACPRAAPVFTIPDTTVFVTVGRLSPEKNQSRLLKAFKLVLETCPDSVLLILGTGPLSSGLKTEATKLQINDRVLFLGQVENPLPVVAAADAMVLSSDWEGQPMTLLEALAVGTHCIGTDIPGIRFVLREGRGVVAPSTPEGLAGAMIERAKNPIGKPDFDLDTYIAAAMADFYREVVGEA